MCATIAKGGTLSDTGVTKNDIYALVDNATISSIVNADISASAAIADTKLATISTAGKVAVSAIASGSLTMTDLQLPETTAPTTAASEGAIYTKDTSGQPELFFREESSGDEVQITSGGAVKGIPNASQLVKAWAHLRWNTGNPTICDSYGVTSITDLAQGKVQLTWSTSFSNAYYGVVATPYFAAGHGEAHLASISQGMSQIWIKTLDQNLVDPAMMSVIAIGD